MCFHVNFSQVDVDYVSKLFTLHCPQLRLHSLFCFWLFVLVQKKVGGQQATMIEHVIQRVTIR